MKKPALILAALPALIGAVLWGLRVPDAPTSASVASPTPAAHLLGESEDLRRALATVAKAAPVAPALPGMSPQLERMMAALGTDEVGARARSAMQEFLADVAQRKQFARFEETAMVKGWIAEPKQGLADIRTLLTRIPAAEFPEFRIELVRTAGLLRAEGAAVLDLANAELRALSVEGGFRKLQKEGVVDPAVPQVVNAFQVGLAQVPDASKALDYTVEQVARQSDPYVRFSLMSAFLKGHEGERAALSQALEARGLEPVEKTLAALGESAQ
jgi:hypothetical protein